MTAGGNETYVITKEKIESMAKRELDQGLETVARDVTNKVLAMVLVTLAEDEEYSPKELKAFVRGFNMRYQMLGTEEIDYEKTLIALKEKGIVFVNPTEKLDK